MYALSRTKWSSHDHSLYLAPIWPSLLLTCTVCVCEYPTHTHPPTLPLPGLITDSFGKTMEQRGSLEGGQASRSETCTVPLLTTECVCIIPFQLSLYFSSLLPSLLPPPPSFPLLPPSPSSLSDRLHQQDDRDWCALRARSMVSWSALVDRVHRVVVYPCTYARMCVSMCVCV